MSRGILPQKYGLNCIYYGLKYCIFVKADDLCSIGCSAQYTIYGKDRELLLKKPSTQRMRRLSFPTIKNFSF
jgi:hypothetical protein